MKKIVTKITSFALAFLVLFSTFSFTVEKHYCGDFLVDVSFIGEADGCAMNIDKVAQTKMKKCCKDEVQKFEGQDELQINKVKTVTFEKAQFLTAFFVSYTNLFIEADIKNYFYKDFSPPDISKNYQVLYQTFLI